MASWLLRSTTSTLRKLQVAFSGKSTGVLVGRRNFGSMDAGQKLDPCSCEEDYRDTVYQNQDLDFPGGKIPLTSQMKFISEASDKRLPCYRVLNDDGSLISNSIHEQIGQEVAVNMYSAMVTLKTMDTFLYEAQRQGRISFYMTSFGEEAINIASAAALSPHDIVLPQYREAGILLWRGFTVQECTNQCFGNKDDKGKGRQMPVHYGSKKHNVITISSPLATQISQAAGVAYSLKMDKRGTCAAAYSGDGGTSEGDFHAGLNFAAVMEAPVIFICRNNGWAISTPIHEQFRSDGVVAKGLGYGIRSIRVDGNDVIAVYSAICAARNMAISEERPILVEAMTYRVGHHSTSDDSTKYRPTNEIEYWKTARSPIARFRKYIQRNGWWSDDKESELCSYVKKQVLQAIKTAEEMEKPSLTELFTDVYEQMPPNLQEQEMSTRDTIKKHPKDYPIDAHI
ncbi:2-oxoisovalerate dehydrogenase subunit alpha 1, mitochondrial-like isoform X1 [Lycium ferocissimum]|uniref:2-oxoisovalerate dehydrogenase subunit alpha 1, mitochondrial-like isoform X1 n=1 Tax=Lycium ferocissimum TaxID=112874 RepID=UPI00281585C2|nr:2-oxoisovalerate dehydrogenase subunit alpha 1, mitochondrial-like isoform X1 [Lycium ferocissimum]